MSREKKSLLRFFLAYFFLALPALIFSQHLTAIENYLNIQASAKDPLYNIYTPTLQRKGSSARLVCKADFFNESAPVRYTDNRNSEMFCFWKIDDRVITKIEDYYQKPTVDYTFPDMIILRYQPGAGIQVKETFLAYSSRYSMIDMEVRNEDSVAHEVSLFPSIYFEDDSVFVTGFNTSHPGISYTHSQWPPAGSSEKETDVTGFFTSFPHIKSIDYLSCNPAEFAKMLGKSTQTEPASDAPADTVSKYVHLIVMHHYKRFRPKDVIAYRYLHGTQSQQQDASFLPSEADELKRTFMKTYLDDDLMLFVNIPKVKFGNVSDKLVYLSVLNMARNSITPASGSSKYNSYSSGVPDSGQQQRVEESAGLMGYSNLDPKSAANSFRIFIRELEDKGTLNPEGAGLQSSFDHTIRKPEETGPFFCWTGWEIYKENRDRQFLKDAYYSGAKQLDCLIEESRAKGFRDLGLNLTIVKEERCLALMAKEIGLKTESGTYLTKSVSTMNFIERTMWNDTSGFYYSLDNQDTSASMGYSGKPKILTGLLPFWSGSMQRERSLRIVTPLADTGQFFRKFGIPGISVRSYQESRSAGTEPKVSLLLNYMLYDGLKRYGFPGVAKLLTSKVMECISGQLRVNHSFWQYYDPDTGTGYGKENYFPDAILSKWLIEENAQ
jgi:hypothetical protein